MKQCKSVVTDTLRHLPESVTFCATVNDVGDEQVITDMMIRRACEQMEDSQVWPYSAAGSAARTATGRLTAAQALSSRSAIIIQFPTSASL